MARAYWDFAFQNKEYYQLMFGLGIPTCEAANQIPALASFSQVILGSIVAMVGSGKKPNFDPWLKYQSFWSMLHGLVSINMVAPDRVNAGHGHDGGQSNGHEDGQSNCREPKEGHKGLPRQVLDDVMCSFIRGVEAAESARQD